MLFSDSDRLFLLIDNFLILSKKWIKIFFLIKIIKDSKLQNNAIQ